MTAKDLSYDINLVDKAVTVPFEAMVCTPCLQKIGKEAGEGTGQLEIGPERGTRPCPFSALEVILQLCGL